jgi:hypothetical protein
MTSGRELSTTLRADAERMEKYGPSPVAAALRAVADLIDEGRDNAGTAVATPRAQLGSAALTWKERLWTVPAETRLSARELVEALGRGIDFVYRHTGPSAPGRRIPHQKIDGALVFIAADVREWLRQSAGAISTPVHLLSRRRSAHAQRNAWDRTPRDGNAVPPQE